MTEWGEGPEFNTERLWTCEACGKHAVLTSKEAHEAGWDTPPYFSGYVKCNNCPISKTALWQNWQEEKSG